MGSTQSPSSTGGLMRHVRMYRDISSRWHYGTGVTHFAFLEDT